MGLCESCLSGIFGVSPPVMKEVCELRPTAPPPTRTGRTRALLVGCNYIGTQAELAGCINDVKNIREILTEIWGWSANSASMRVLVDDGSGDGYPTRDTILASLAWLVQDAQSGDAIFFSYSGHGAQEVDPNGFEEDGMNETILPRDFEQSGMISDDTLTECCIQHLPEGVKFTSIMDCCHSGSALDLAWTWQGDLMVWKEDTNPFHLAADVQMISGCTDEQTSADGAQDLYGRRSGALTTAFCDVVRRTRASPSSNISFAALLQQMQSHIYANGFSQNPQLTSSQAFDACSVPFSLTDSQMNANTQLGRIFRHKFSPQPRPMEGPLADMLSDLGMMFVQDELLDAFLAGDGDGPKEDEGLLGGLLGESWEDDEDDDGLF